MDPEDYEWLTQYNWHLHRGRSTLYAVGTTFRNRKRIPLKMHRMIMNAPKGLVVDHINHNGLDNRKANLRLATNAQNCYNRASFKKKDSPSQYKGVYWSKRDNRWQVQISYKGKCRTIGLYKDEIQAAKAYDKAALKYHKEFAYLNLPKKS